MKSISFFTTLRASRSSSAAASVRTVSLSGVKESVPLVRGELNEPGGVPGEPDFLCSKELKKFARTPSLPGADGLILASICGKND